jgi:hypothetical protein
VSNAGDGVNAVFDFVIPRGDVGPVGPAGGLLEFDTVAAFPATGETGRAYLSKDTGDTYRWDATAKALTYVRISERVKSTGIEDSTVVGRKVITAVDEAAGRTAIGAENIATKAQPGGYAPLGADSLVPAVHLPARTAVNLRDWVDVAAANWKTFQGMNLTAGSAAAGNTPFTAADIGKIVMVLLDSATSQWWMAKITALGTNGFVALDTPAPVTVGNCRVRYGFDGTTAINNALAAVDGTADGPVDVYLGGNYRVTQLLIPSGVVLHGVPWKPTTVQQLGYSSRTVIAQLPGAETDLIRFKDNPQFAGVIWGCGLMDLELRGPETNVSGKPAATVGNGVSLRVAGSNSGYVIDGFRLERVAVYDFPESGFLCRNAVPMYVNECKALHNGRYGFELNKTLNTGASMNAVHFLNFSADWNNLGAVGCIKLTANDTVFFTGVKSEGTAANGASNATRGGPNFQSECLVFEDCDSTPVLVNGLSHIRVGAAGTGPGPAIAIRDTAAGGRRPKITFNSVLVRISGAETGDITGAVTLRDSVKNVDVGRVISAGSYPAGYTPSIVDQNGKNLILMQAVPNANSGFVVYNNTLGQAPILGVADSGSTDTGLSLSPKGLGAVQIGGTAPRIAASGTNNNLNLMGNGLGVVQQNGVQVELKGHTHVAADVVGAEKTANRGVVNGYASLDSVGRIPSAQLSLPAVEWKGEWNAATNSPVLANGTGLTGDLYRVNTAGTQVGLTVAVGDVVIYDGVVWRKLGSGPWTTVPASATAPGTAGQLAYDATHLYVAVAANTWKTIAYGATFKAP